MFKKIKLNSVVTKMFIITFVSMLIVIISIFVVLKFYMENYYRDNKINKLIDNINIFASKAVKDEWNYEQIIRQVPIFNDSNNATMTIEYYKIKDNEYIQKQLSKDFLLTIKYKNEFYDLFLNQEEIESVFGYEEPKNKDVLKIVAYKTEDNLLIPIIINGKPLDNDHKINDGEYFKIEGKAVIEKIIYVPEQIIDGAIYNSAEEAIEIKPTERAIYFKDVNDFVHKWNLENEGSGFTKRGIMYSINDMPYVNYKELVFSKFVTDKNDNIIAINVSASLQPVNEVVAMINNYFFIFFILSAIISLIIAYVYSNLISKPLIKVTKVANKMANMDFEVKLKETRSDELGILYKSLNTLSSNLDNAMSDLKEANEKLKFDIEKEKKQEQIRREFVANVSHELKTPLGIIKGFAEGLKDGVKKEKKNYYIDVILDEIEGMNKLILDMLELSKIEHKKLNKIEEFEIKDVIDKVLNTLEVKLKERRIDIKVYGDFKKVKGDKFNIEQVLKNFLSNAIKYGSEDSTIEIKGKTLQKKNYIYVYNEGQRFKEEELDSIWLRFFKVDKSHSRNEGGIGLGLAIVKAILDKHNSDYGVYNKQNGVEFYFSLDISEGKRV
ncbi:HAMP domain-containing sensor histidine kinase [Clostridiaceae bacterium M8S5]|nr:HAMP domain-containing sensor histidine kinase [Clostridiaceae bacterium M8S5]